jgi:hypothetical protein
MTGALADSADQHGTCLAAEVAYGRHQLDRRAGGRTAQQRVGDRPEHGETAQRAGQSKRETGRLKHRHARRDGSECKAGRRCERTRDLINQRNTFGQVRRVKKS